MPDAGPPDVMEAQEPASGGVHDTKWTAKEIAEWEEKVAQVTRVAQPQRKRVSEAGVCNERGPPEAMDYATATALAALVADVKQWGGRLSRHLVAHDGVRRFTNMQLSLQQQMLQSWEPAHLVREMPDDPSGHWTGWPLAAEEKWKYVKDLLHRHRGEVREIWGEWQLVHEPLPKGESFHHAQFSLTSAGSKELSTFTGKSGKMGGRKGGKGDDGRWRQGKNQEKGNDDGRWRQEWGNTMVQCDWDDDAKHWKREASCFGLAEMFARFGARYTAKHLYRYYLAARILVHKRVHGKSAPERTEAAQKRYKATGRYGFGDGKG